MVPTKGFAAVNEASEGSVGTTLMGVLIVKGGATVCVADTVGIDTVGTFGKLPENCVTCWFWSRSPKNNPYPPRNTNFELACQAKPALGPKLLWSPSTMARE